MSNTHSISELNPYLLCNNNKNSALNATEYVQKICTDRNPPAHGSASIMTASSRECPPSRLIVNYSDIRACRVRTRVKYFFTPADKHTPTPAFMFVCVCAWVYEFVWVWHMRIWKSINSAEIVGVRLKYCSNMNRSTSFNTRVWFNVTQYFFSSFFFVCASSLCVFTRRNS